MNINNLTIGQAKDLVKMFCSDNAKPSQSPMLGKHCVVRTYSAGVHIGTVTAHDGKEVLLIDSRRLWRWGGAFTLSEVAMFGIDPQKSRVAASVPELFLTEAIELIPTSEVARKKLEACHE